MKAADSDEWKKAQEKEAQSLKDKEVYTWVNLPDGVKPVDSKWVYDLKFTPDNQIERYKARVTAKGYTQQYGIDYFEAFAPVIR